MILFTADWHIKLGQKNVPVEWAKDRYRSFFAHLSRLEGSVSSHIIGGDIFDRLPTMPELQLYFEFISNVTVPTIIFDGNHEASTKNNTFLEFLALATNSINPLITVITEPTEFDSYSILPYCHLHKKGSIEALNQDKVLFTHVRGEIPPHVKPEVDLDRFANFPIVYAGDLHAHSNSQRNIVYPGSPMTTSFHRNQVRTGYLLIDEQDLTVWDWFSFELPQLIRKTVSSTEEMVKTDFDHTIYEIEGDIQDLAKVENSELLDKKVLKRSSDTALILTTEMTEVDELIEYLMYILEIEQIKIDRAVKLYNDYT